MTERFQMECMGESVVLELSDASWEMHGYDPDADAAWIALSGERSDCWILYQGLVEGDKPLPAGVLGRHRGPKVGFNLALNKAAELGMSDLVGFIVGNVMGPMGWGWSALPDVYYALGLAAENGHAEVIHVLFEAGLPFGDGEADEAVAYAYHAGQDDVLNMFQGWFESCVESQLDWPDELLGKV